MNPVPIKYDRAMHERLRVKFSGSDAIAHNYSATYQDLFVLTMLDGKRDGSFLEIGSGHPTDGSNTKLLEEFGWTGISVDFNPILTAMFAKERKSKTITQDAVTVDYPGLIKQDYDYLQIDVEPALNSFNVLTKIPFDTRRFAVVTFEHDDYCSVGSSIGIKERSRGYLYSSGYVMVVGDIGLDDTMNYEDWWIHPQLVDPMIVTKMFNSAASIKRADRYMLL